MHPHPDEAFYVGEGAAGFLLGGGIPRGTNTNHTTWNSANAPMRGLILISPGDAEHVFSPVDRPTSPLPP